MVHMCQMIIFAVIYFHFFLIVIFQVARGGEWGGDGGGACKRSKYSPK